MTLNMRKLANQVLVDDSMCLKWAQDHSLIPKNPQCNVCGNKMKMKVGGPNYIRFKCQKRAGIPHLVLNNALANTFFEHSRFGIRNIVTIMYYFSINQTHYEFLIRECSSDNVVASTASVCSWMSYCREVCFAWIYDLFDREELLGGRDVVVEIEECQIGKQKYKIGNVGEGTWILYIFEINFRNESRKCSNEKYKIEICPGNKRDANTLIPLILKHVKPGTVIVTELWKSFFQLTDKGYTLFSVNHNHNFMYPIVIKNNVISSLGIVKKTLKLGPLKEGLAAHFSEYIYRRQVLMSGEDPFDYFIKAVKHCFSVYVNN